MLNDMLNCDNLFITKFRKDESDEFLISYEYEVMPNGFKLKTLGSDLKFNKLNEAIGAINSGGILYSKREEVNVPFSIIKKPIDEPRNVIGVAWNYKSHVDETSYFGNPRFFKVDPSSLTDPFSSLKIDESQLIDYEIELGILINKKIDINSGILDPDELIAGFFLINDITSRRIQIERGSLLDKLKGFKDAKSIQRSKPFGPFLAKHVDRDSMLRLSVLRDKEEIRQEAPLHQMIYSPIELISCLVDIISENNSESLLENNTLYPGDIIMTGTPSGTAYKSGILDIVKRGGKRRFLQKELENNGDYLRSGDIVIGDCNGLGMQRLRII